MARKRFEIITGLTDLQAAIYNEDNLPSAIISDKHGNQPYCLHSLRSEGLSYFDDVFLVHMLSVQSLEKKDIDQLQLRIYKFYENYESQGNVCHGCARSEKLEHHEIRDTEQVAKKLCEDCA